MKKILLLAGMMLFLLPGTAAAFELEPLSPQISQVLERAQTLVTEAAHQGELAAFFEDEMFPEWEQEFLSTLFLPIDTEQHVIAQSKSLPGDTACFRYDQFVLDRAIAYVRQLMDAAEDRHDIIMIFRLEEAHTFLTDAQRGLLEGALHPGTQYEAWRLPFADETEEEAANLSDLCFYNSDYTPASPGIPDTDPYHGEGPSKTVDGFGCDKETLLALLDRVPPDAGPLMESMEIELRAVTIAQDAANIRVRTAEDLRTLQVTADGIIAGETPTGPRPLPVERLHKTETGCMESPNPGVVLHALEGQFSIDPDDVHLTFEYRNQQLERDAERHQPDAFEPRENDSPLQNLLTMELQDRLRVFTANRTALESATFAAGVDPGLNAQDIFADLRTSVQALVTLGNSMTNGIRGFVRDYAYFLLRSCSAGNPDNSVSTDGGGSSGRPCTARLERVLKLNFTDECFAYGNGEYLKATPDDPQWKKCLCKADPGAAECDL